MRNKGFTLVELLAVLIVLSIIMTMIIISVNSVISSSERSLSKIQKEKVEEAAEVYYLKEGDMSKNSGCINVQALISKGYIEGSTVTDPETGLVMNGSVRITYEANQYNYNYQTNSCEVYCEYDDVDEDDNYSLGDEIACGTEQFYLISSDTDTLTMLAKKNIEVTINNPKQSLSAGTTSFATSAYWWDSNNFKTGYTTIQWGNNTVGEIYRVPEDKNNATVTPYLEAYETYLEGLGFANVSAHLININEAVAVINGNQISILNSAGETYWTALAVGPYSAYVLSNPTLQSPIDGDAPTSQNGVRPVIIIDKSYVPLPEV